MPPPGTERSAPMRSVGQIHLNDPLTAAGGARWAGGAGWVDGCGSGCCARRGARGRWLSSGAQHQNLPYRDAVIGTNMIPPCQVAKVEVMTPGDAVERVVGAHDVIRPLLCRSIGTGTKQEATQSKGANRARGAQLYRCKPDSKGTKLTVPSD